MDKDFKTTQSVLNDAKEILLNEDNVFPSKEELIKKVKNNTLTIREAIQLHYYSTKNKIKIPPRFSNEALGGDKEFISQLSDIQSTSKDNATFKNNIAGIKTLVNSFRKADIDIDNTLFKDLTPTDPETGFISPDVLKNYQSKVLTDAGKTGQGRMLKLKQIESGIDSVVKVDPSITFRKDINILSDERVGIPGEKQRRTRGKDAGVGVTTKGQRIRGAFDLQKSEKELIEDFTKSINKVGETNPNYKRFFWLNLIAPSRLSNELFDVVIFDKNDTEANWYKNWKDPNNLKKYSNAFQAFKGYLKETSMDFLPPYIDISADVNDTGAGALGKQADTIKTLEGMRGKKSYFGGRVTPFFQAMLMNQAKDAFKQYKEDGSGVRRLFGFDPSVTNLSDALKKSGLVELLGELPTPDEVGIKLGNSALTRELQGASDTRKLTAILVGAALHPNSTPDNPLRLFSDEEVASMLSHIGNETSNIDSNMLLSSYRGNLTGEGARNQIPTRLRGMMYIEQLIARSLGVTKINDLGIKLGFELPELESYPFKIEVPKVTDNKTASVRSLQPLTTEDIAETKSQIDLAISKNRYEASQYDLKNIQNIRKTQKAVIEAAKNAPEAFESRMLMDQLKAKQDATSKFGQPFINEQAEKEWFETASPEEKDAYARSQNPNLQASHNQQILNAENGYKTIEDFNNLETKEDRVNYRKYIQTLGSGLRRTKFLPIIGTAGAVYAGYQLLDIADAEASYRKKYSEFMTPEEIAESEQRERIKRLQAVEEVSSPSPITSADVEAVQDYEKATEAGEDAYRLAKREEALGPRREGYKPSLDTEMSDLLFDPRKRSKDELLPKATTEEEKRLLNTYAGYTSPLERYRAKVKLREMKAAKTGTKEFYEAQAQSDLKRAYEGYYEELDPRTRKPPQGFIKSQMN